MGWSASSGISGGAQWKDLTDQPLPSALARSDAAPASGDAMFRVYNRNVFLGGDTGPLHLAHALGTTGAPPVNHPAV